MTLEQAQPNIIWPRLDRYKTAVIAKKTSAELDALRLELLKEIEQLAGASPEITDYVNSQYEQIEQRYLSSAEARQMARGPFKN